MQRLIRSGFVCLVAVFGLLLIGPWAGQAAAAQRIAILPVVARQPFVDAPLVKAVTDALNDRFHTPLDTLVPVFDVVPADLTTAALGRQQFDPNTTIIDGNLLDALAEALDAELVVAAEITDYRFIIHHSPLAEHDQTELTHMAITLHCYQRSCRQYTKRGDYQDYQGAVSTFGDPRYIASAIMRRLVTALPPLPPGGANPVN